MSIAEQTKQPKRQIGQKNSSKKQMPKRERQEKTQKNILWIFGGAIGVAIVALILALVFNWYIPDVRPLNKVFLKIDGREYNMRYFMDTLYTYVGGGIQAYYYIDVIPDMITNNYFIVEYVKQNGGNITDKDISNYIKERGLRNNEATRDIVAAMLASQYLQNEIFKPEIGNSADQYQIMAILVESAEDVAKTIDGLADDKTWEELAFNSLNSYSKNNNAKIPWNPLPIITAPANLNSDLLNAVLTDATIGDIFSFYDADTTKNLAFWIVKVTAETNNPNNTVATRQVSVILVGSQEEADEVRAKLADGGNFAELAKEYSQHEASKDKGGDLGQVAKNDLPTIIGNYVFGIEAILDIEGTDPAPIGQISEALRDVTENTPTTGGYWVCQVVDFGANLSLTEDQISKWINIKYDALTTALNKSNESRVVNTFTDDLRQYVHDHA